MTEPILAAEVLAEAWVVREAVASSLDALALDGSMALLRKLSSEINDEGYYGWAEGVQAEIDALARIDKEAHDG